MHALRSVLVSCWSIIIIIRIVGTFWVEALLIGQEMQNEIPRIIIATCILILRMWANAKFENLNANCSCYTATIGIIIVIVEYELSNKTLLIDIWPFRFIDSNNNFPPHSITASSLPKVTINTVSVYEDNSNSNSSSSSSANYALIRAHGIEEIVIHLWQKLQMRVSVSLSLYSINAWL